MRHREVKPLAQGYPSWKHWEEGGRGGHRGSAERARKDLSTRARHLLGDLQPVACPPYAQGPQLHNSESDKTSLSPFQIEHS